MKHSPINKVSKKQAQNNALEDRIRAKIKREQLDEVGYLFCQKCGRSATWLELVHEKGKGRGGKTDEENCKLWCWDCHHPGGKLGSHFNQ